MLDTGRSDTRRVSRDAWAPLVQDEAAVPPAAAPRWASVPAGGRLSRRVEEGLDASHAPVVIVDVGRAAAAVGHCDDRKDDHEQDRKSHNNPGPASLRL